jgi:hypothetical protein
MASPRGLPESDLSNAEKGASEKITIPVKPLPRSSDTRRSKNPRDEANKILSNVFSANREFVSSATAGKRRKKNTKRAGKKRRVRK